MPPAQAAEHAHPARELFERKVPLRRIKKALGRLRDHLPDDVPVGTLRFRCRGEEIVVDDGRDAWAPESGQLVFDFQAQSI